MKKVLFTSFVMIALYFNFVNATVYVGSGVTIYKTKYQSKVVRMNQNLTLNGTVITNIQMQAPIGSNDIQLLSINDATLPGANGATDYIVGCVDSNGVVIERVGLYGDCNNGVLSVLNKEQVLIDFGMQFLNYTQVNLSQLSQNEKLDLALYTAQNVLSNFEGSDNINTAKDVFDIFNNSNNKPLNVNGGLYMQLMVNTTEVDELSKWEQVVNKFKDAVLNGFGFADDVVYNSSEFESGIGGFISFGFLDKAKMNKKIFYGFEGVLGLENLNIEDSKVDDFILKGNVSVSLIGRLGYSFARNSLSYLNAGFGFQEYRLQQGDLTDDKFLTPYGLIGVGLEFAISPFYNIFGEYNYNFSLKKIKPQHTLVESVSIKSTKMNIGVRYYLGPNIIRTKDVKRSNQTPQKVANAFTKTEEVERITNYTDVKFRDAKKFRQKNDTSKSTAKQNRGFKEEKFKVKMEILKPPASIQLRERI